MITDFEEIVSEVMKENPGLSRSEIKRRIQTGSDIIELPHSTLITFGRKRIDENLFDLTKKLWVLDLKRYRQTSCVNFRAMIDSFKAQGVDLTDDIVKGLEAYDPRYSETYLMDISNWTDLGAFLRMQEIVKEKTNNPNPRQFMQHGLYSGLMKTYFQIVDLKLKFGAVRSVYELLPEETRNANYDLITQYLLTKKEGQKLQSRFIMKYFDNFRGEIPIDHKWWVISIISGLAKRKKRDFAKPRIEYFDEDLVTVLSRDYAYMGWKVKRAKSGEVTVDGKAISHPVAFRKVVEKCTMHPMSRIWQKFSFVEEREIYDPHPIEIDSSDESEDLVRRQEVVIADQVDETLVDMQDHIIIKGERYGLPITLVDFFYGTKKGGDKSSEFYEIESRKKTWAERLAGIGSKEEARARLQIRTIEAIRQADRAMIAENNERHLREHLEDIVEARTAALKEEQRKRRQSETMAAVTYLHIGMAHNLNNPLKAIEVMMNQQSNTAERLIIDQRFLNAWGISEEDQIGLAEFLHEKYSGKTKLQDIDTGVATRVGKELKSRILDISPEIKLSVRHARNLAKYNITIEDIPNLSTYLRRYSLETIMEILDYTYKIKSPAYGAKQKFAEAYDIINSTMDVAEMANREDVETDLNEGIETILTEYQSTFEEQDVTVITDFAPNLPKIHMGTRIIKQLYQNMISNALYALSPFSDKREISFSTYMEGEKVIAEISDTGEGVPEENLSKIFLPFFTTKPEGEGKGIGLYSVHEIMNLYGGIEVLSKERETTFRITIDNEKNTIEL